MLEKRCCKPHVKEIAIQSEYPSQQARNKHNHLKCAAESPTPQGNDDGRKWDTSRESPCSKKRVKGTAFDCLAWSNLKEEGDALICSRHSSVNTISHRVEIGVGSGNSNLKASQDHSTLT